MLSWEPPAVFDDFRVVRPLGKGGMGRVFLGHDRLLDRPVAIKFIAADEPDAARLQRFHNEARAIARLRHPNVVIVHRAGVIEGRPYFIQEFVRGKSLDQLDKPMAAEAALRVAVGLARGLAAAHRAGLVHRDVKPANAVQAEDGEVKLLDFGLAKFVDEIAAAPGERTASLPGANGAAAGELVTAEGAAVGTPRYMAPEVRRGEPATRRSDVYSLGLVLQEIGGAEPRLQPLVQKCLQSDPQLRYPSAEELAADLEALLPLRRKGPIPEGNPYRGLQAFEAEHQALFFGREGDARAVLELLRREALVVVAGDSGVGKSSLCAAGVVPMLADETTPPLHGATAVRVIPGAHPARAMARALAPVIGGSEEALEVYLESGPEALREALRRFAAQHPAAGLLLFVDQAEELFTQASAEAAARFGCALALVAALAGSARVLIALRADYLTRLAALPGLGEDAVRALYLVRPLSAARFRETIAGPARCTGYSFESEALIEELAASAERAAGGLPLLQFALAELWELRDEPKKLIPSSALKTIGGVKGALARHADQLLASLLPEQRAAVRSVLCRLVTAEGTRSRRTAAELGAESPPGSAALAALVRGRLVVEREEGGAAVFEVAHEALLQGWQTLRDWLDHDVDRRLERGRIEAATREWLRLERSDAALWDRARLLEASRVPEAELGPNERSFLSASRRWRRRMRLVRFISIAALPSVALLVAGAMTWQARRAQDAGMRLRDARASELIAKAEGAETKAVRAREKALAAFARSKSSPQFSAARELWIGALEERAAAADAYESAGLALESALAIDPGHAASRALLADVLAGQARLAASFLDAETVARIGRRLIARQIPGRALPAFLSPARVEIDVRPRGAAVSIAAVEPAAGRAVVRADKPLGKSPLAIPALDAGSYLLRFRDRDAREVRLPLFVAGGERLAIRFALPASVPDGFVFVPPGRFLAGSGADDERRHALGAPPLHEVTTGAYLIARHEVTFAQYLAFLDALPPAERTLRTPGTRSRHGALELRRTASGWELMLRPTVESFRAKWGEPIRYPRRDSHAVHDWRKLPVSAVSLQDARAYAAWLSAKSLPGAHVCDDHEWERAARGADGRDFTTGERLFPAEVNIDETYGRKSFGPDEVGSHPESASIFGVEDMTGNAMEMVISIGGFGPASERGGSWHVDEWSARLPARFAFEETTRSVTAGFRICASAEAE